MTVHNAVRHQLINVSQRPAELSTRLTVGSWSRVQNNVLNDNNNDGYINQVGTHGDLTEYQLIANIGTQLEVGRFECIVVKY